MDASRVQPPRGSQGGLPWRFGRWVRNASGCLGWRLVTVLVGSLLVLLGLSGWLALELHRKHLLSLLEETAIGIGETILFSAHASMLENDRDHLAQIVDNIGGREAVLVLRLLDSRGTVGFSSRHEEVGTSSDLGAPLCQGCHQGGEPRAPANLRDGLQLSPSDGALGLVIPVLNSPECSNAACHVHPAEQRVLGMLDLELSTRRLDAAMHDARRWMATLAAITIVVIAATIGILTWRIAHQPIRALLVGTRRLAGGDLSHRIDLSERPSGEIGELAASFNDMSSRLQRAQEELEAWNQRLETKIREKTRELEQARDQIVFAEKMASLGKLAAIVAHEINNPLAGVLIYTKLVRRRLAEIPSEHPEGEAPAEWQALAEKLGTVETEVARCGDIVRNLLRFSRHREAAREPTDINAAVTRAMRLVQHQADLTGVEVRLELDPELPEVFCEVSQIQQAILAAVMNGLEAMPDGGTLALRTWFVPENDEAVIEIRDTGVGIPEELHTKIFEPFFSTKQDGRGTGLGLAVMYGIVQRHQGGIDFDSAPGKGTSFRIILPVHPKTRDTADPAWTPAPQGGE